MNITNAITTIDVAGTKVVFHVEHDDGASSYKVEHGEAGVTVYLHGTVEQLAEFAAAITRAISVRAINEVEQANREANAGYESPLWLRVTGASRWCFVCQAWVHEWQTHAHAERTDCWHPNSTAELAQRDRATFMHRLVAP